MPTERINVLIVEDESIVALDLSLGLEHDGYHVVGIADSNEDAVKLFSEQEVDIVLMDVHINGSKDGIDTAGELIQIKKIPIIYLTAFSDAETISRAKKTFPAAFLTKPYSLNNVRIAMELAVHNFAAVQQPEAKTIVDAVEKSTVNNQPDKELLLQLNDYIFVKHQYRFVKLRLSDLLYVEADNNYINLITADVKLAIRLSLNQFMDKINYPKLVRIHRSFAINLDAIQSFTEQEITIGKQELPIGRNYRDTFLSSFHCK